MFCKKRSRKGKKRMLEFILDNLGPLGVGMIFTFYGAQKIIKKLIYDSVDALCVHVFTEPWFLKTTFFSQRRGTFRYFYEGQNYILKQSSYLNPRSLREGEHYQIFVNPKHPERFFTIFDYRYGWAFFIFGVILIIGIFAQWYAETHLSS